MITPQKMSEFERNKVIEMFSKLNQDLTATIIKKLQKNEDISSFTRSQMKALARQGGNEVFKEALGKVNGISRERKKQLLALFNEIQAEEMKGYKTTYEAKGLDFEISREVQQLVNSMYKQTDKELKNMTKTIAFSSKQAYVKGLDKLYTKVASGSFDYSSAMKSTINSLAEQGITLKDKAGRNVSLETAVKRNLMTSLTKTANDISKSVGDTIGVNCVYIGSSPTCRPSHHPINDVVMSLKEFKKYEYLTMEFNCNHIVNYDWRPEFDNKNQKTIFGDNHGTIKEITKNYDERQEQNYYARVVRSKKKEILSLQGTNNTDILDKKKKELRNSQMKYRQYSKSKGLEIDYDKTWVTKYNK